MSGGKWNLGKEAPKAAPPAGAAPAKPARERPKEEDIKQAAAELKDAPMAQRRQPTTKAQAAEAARGDAPPLGTAAPEPRRPMARGQLGKLALALVLFAAAVLIIGYSMRPASERFGAPPDFGRPVDDIAFLVAVERGASPGLEDLEGKRAPHREEARARLLIAHGDILQALATIVESIEEGRQPSLGLLEAPPSALPSPETRVMDRQHASTLDFLLQERRSEFVALAKEAARRHLEARTPSIELQALATRLRAEGLVALHAIAGQDAGLARLFPELPEAPEFLADIRGELPEAEIQRLLEASFGAEGAAAVQQLRGGS